METFLPCVLFLASLVGLPALIEGADPSPRVAPGPAARRGKFLDPLPRHNWRYSAWDDLHLDPDTWSASYASCGGKRQSPIEILTTKVTKAPQLPSLSLKNYEVVPDGARWKFTNDGRSVKLTTSFAAIPEMESGGLPETYIFDSLHFHWGRNSSLGSEHVVDGKNYPLEVHLVHKSKPANGKGDDHDTHLAVLGTFFEITNNPAEVSPVISNLVQKMRRVSVPRSKVYAALTNFTLMDLLPTNKSFYRYLGSLTVPPCSENVVWTVFMTPLKVTEDLLTTFRSLWAYVSPSARANSRDGVLLMDTYRNPQSLNDRLVQAYIEQ